MHIIADCAATLGSRFNLLFDPRAGRLLHNACGDFRERPLRLTAGIRLSSGEVLSLPFGGGTGAFPFLEQFSTPTTIEYRGAHPDLGIGLSMKLRAPFYPQDARLSTAPFHYVDLTAWRLESWSGTRCESPPEGGEIVFAIEGEAVEFETIEGGFRYTFQSTSQLPCGPEPNSQRPGTKTVPVSSSVRCPEAEREGPSGLRRPFDPAEQTPAKLALIWSSWIEAPALEVRGEQTELKYHQFFKSEEEMASWAGEKRQEIEARCDFFDGLFRDWSLGRATSHLAALALHSFLANTWWTTRKDGSDWFSVWQGPGRFHSAVDVEYNSALLYFALWPRLLEMLLEEWSEFEVDARESYGAQAKGTSFLCGDMGQRHVVGLQAHPHHMEVEENADYLLLLAARTFFQGDMALAQRKVPLCRRLAEFIIRADTMGTGFPDRGVANTITDAGPALQFGRQQTYLAVKAQAALWALGELEGALESGDDSCAERWKAFAAKSVKTLDEKAWLGDHFAVSLDRTTEGLVDPRTGEGLPEGELEGWNDYSIYAANGLLYMFLANMKMPRWKLARFARDLENAEFATRTPYGSTHTARTGGIVWISQNLWRDFVAAYLGIDSLNNVEAYWDYQVLMADSPRASPYCDTSPGGDLDFSPRGAASFGAAASAAGLRLNRLDKELHLAPIRPRLRVPLLPLVDWKNMRAPWLTVRSREGVVVAEISERDLLGGLSVHVAGAEMEDA